MEKRALSRVVLQMDAAVRWRDGGVEGQVENLSLRGAFVSAGEKPPPQAPVDVTIRLSGPTAPRGSSREPKTGVSPSSSARSGWIRSCT